MIPTLTWPPWPVLSPGQNEADLPGGLATRNRWTIYIAVVT